MKNLTKSLFIIAALALTSASAQSYSGNGIGSTGAFTVSRPWIMGMTANATAEVVLFNASTQQPIKNLRVNETNNETGSFVIGVNTTSTWQINILEQGAAAYTDTSPLTASEKQYQDAVANYGKPRYSRSGQSTNLYNCSDFATSDAAQRFFNAQGGPSYDPHGLDRDRDGFACEWDPRQRYSKPAAPQPFRAAPSTSRCGANSHWVQGYTRRDGVSVRGHCRRN